jgi:glycosyltransferase involved in cell wall biosynthesis
VASELPGYANVARADVDALLVPPGDATALAAALRRALDDGALRRRLVTSGEQRAASFSLDRLADRYLDLYRGMLAGGRPER